MSSTIVSATVCPACEFEQQGDGDSCARCGAIFAKARSSATRPETPSTIVVSPPLVDSDRAAWRIFAIGVATAVVAQLVPLTRMLTLVAVGAGLWLFAISSGWRREIVIAAIFVQLQTMRFAWSLRSDASYLELYRQGKGGALMGDLEVIALDVTIHTGWTVDIEQVAGWLLVASLLPVVVAGLRYRYRRQVDSFGRSLLLLDPD